MQQKTIDKNSLNETLFEQNDFQSPSSEQSIAIVRSSKESMNMDLSHFWTQVCKSQHNPMYNALTLDEFLDHMNSLFEAKVDSDTNKIKEKVISHLSLLKDKYELDLGSPIAKSFIVLDEWNDNIYLLETETEFIFFRWDTTA